MTRNMSTLDRWLRGLLVGPAAIVAAVFVGVGSPAGIVLLVFGVVMAVAAVVGVCPLYALLHVDGRGRTPLPH